MNSVIVSKQLRLSHGASLVKACQESGMTVNEWCSTNGITKHTYYYWKRKLKDLCLDQMEMPSFVDISGTGSVNANAVLPCREASASVMANGVRIDLYEQASPSFLRNLLEAAKNA